MEKYENNRFSFIQDVIKDNNYYYFFNENSHLIGLYLYENFCTSDNEQEICKEEPSKLRLGFLQNILLLFFSVLGYRYLKMISIFNNIIIKKTQNFLRKIVTQTDVNLEIKEEGDKEILEKNEFEIDLSTILNDLQEIDENEIEKDFFDNIKDIVLRFLNISIVDEM